MQVKPLTYRDIYYSAGDERCSLYILFLLGCFHARILTLFILYIHQKYPHNFAKKHKIQHDYTT